MTTQTQVIRAAVVQAAPIAFDRERTLAKVCALTAEAAAQDAQLVVFPEAFVSGYPRGLSFGAVVGDRSAEGREEYRRYWESAVDIPGPAMEELARSAAQSHVYLVIGVIERGGGTLYCTVVFFAPDGSYLGKHRKLMPTASERLIWGFGDGSTLPVFDTPVGRLGAVICWENYMPLARAQLEEQSFAAAWAEGRLMTPEQTLGAREPVMNGREQEDWWCWRILLIGQRLPGPLPAAVAHRAWVGHRRGFCTRG